MAIRESAPQVVFRELDCVLTASEIREAEKQAAQLTKRYDDLEKEKKQINDDLTGRLKSIREAKGLLAEKAVTGIEKRMVECIWEIVREDGIKQLVRTDAARSHGHERDGSRFAGSVDGKRTADAFEYGLWRQS